jgi:hypothetical protein
MSFNTSTLTDAIKKIRAEPLMADARILVGGELFIQVEETSRVIDSRIP